MPSRLAGLAVTVDRRRGARGREGIGSVGQHLAAVGRLDGPANDVHVQRNTLDGQPHPLAEPDMQQVEQALAGHCLVVSAEDPPLGDVERIRVSRRAHPLGRDGCRGTGHERGDLESRVEGRNVRIGRDEMAGLRVAQPAWANGQGRSEADTAWLRGETVQSRQAAQADRDHHHRDGEAADDQRGAQPPGERVTCAEDERGRQADQQRQPGKARQPPAGGCHRGDAGG